jgi:hypothetical protein
VANLALCTGTKIKLLKSLNDEKTLFDEPLAKAYSTFGIYLTRQ